MPVELHVIRASEFVCLDPHELLDFEATKKALQSLAVACHKRGVGCAVVDLRGLPVPSRPQFTKTQLAALVGTFRDAGFSQQQRLAVLYQQDIHGGIRDFAFISRMRGLQVQAFTDFEAALLWLSEGEKSESKPGQSGIPVPITQARDKVNKLRVRGNGGQRGNRTANPKTS